MAEYIERGSAMRTAHMLRPEDKELMSAISISPAADVASVRHGRWIEEDSCQICSECGEEHEWDEYRAAYCDVCGAKMDGAE